jgi:hypothetical protein
MFWGCNPEFKASVETFEWYYVFLTIVWSGRVETVNYTVWWRQVCSNPDKCPNKCPFWRLCARLLKNETQNMKNPICDHYALI